MTDALSVILRALSFALLFQAAGTAFFVAIFGRPLSVTHEALRRLGLACAIAAIVFTCGHYALEAARAAGELAGVFDSSLQAMILQTTIGTAFSARIFGLALVALGLRARGDLAASIAVIGAAVTVLSFVFTGHTAVDADRWWMAVLLMAHLLVVAFWFGALVPLFLVSSRESVEVTAQVVGAFSSVAAWLVPLIFVAGLALACGLVPGLSVVGEPYGLLLIAKAAGFALLMGLATLNKWRLGPALARDERGAGRRFRFSLGLEFTLIVGVLTITAVLTSFFSPD